MQAIYWDVFLILGLILASGLLATSKVPRPIALVRPERIARMLAWPVRALATIAGPCVGVLSWATDRVLRFLGVRPGPTSHPGRDFGLAARRDQGGRLRGRRARDDQASLPLQ